MLKSNVFLEFFNKNYFQQSLKLIEAKYKLEPLEQQILAKIIMSLQDNTNLVCEFQTLKLIKELELEETKARQNLKDSCRQLLSRVLSLKDNNELIQTHWLETIIYRENSVVFGLNAYLKPFLLQLQNLFLYLNSQQIMKMKSQYSGCIYVLLKYYYELNKATEIRFTLKELLDLLGCSYKKYFDFKVNVLDMLEKDINKNTDMQINYLPEKVGRKVEYIKFEFIIN